MVKKTESTQSQDKAQSDPARLNGVAAMIAVVLVIIAVLAAIVMDYYGVASWIIVLFSGILIVLAINVLMSLKIADQWERAVVLRFGKFHGLRGPGLFWIIPIVGRVARWIDHRVMVTPFNAEKMPIKD